MTSTEQQPRIPRRNESNSAAHRLERNIKDLISLKDQLSSYICEPKTRKLFERMESLRNRLEAMIRANREIITGLNEHTLLAEDAKQRTKKQFDSYQELELNVLEYIGIAKLHC